MLGWLRSLGGGHHLGSNRATGAAASSERPRAFWGVGAGPSGPCRAHPDASGPGRLGPKGLWSWGVSSPSRDGPLHACPPPQGMPTVQERRGADLTILFSRCRNQGPKGKMVRGGPAA